MIPVDGCGNILGFGLGVITTVVSSRRSGDGNFHLALLALVGRLVARSDRKIVVVDVFGCRGRAATAPHVSLLVEEAGEGPSQHRGRLGFLLLLFWFWLLLVLVIFFGLRRLKLGQELIQLVGGVGCGGRVEGQIELDPYIVGIWDARILNGDGLEDLGRLLFGFLGVLLPRVEKASLLFGRLGRRLLTLLRCRLALAAGLPALLLVRSVREHNEVGVFGSRCLAAALEEFHGKL